MFYEQDQIDNNLVCLKCSSRYEVPRLLPCGDSICTKCALKLLIKTTGSTFGCPICKDTHEIPSQREFPANKTLLRILKQKPSEVTRSDAIEHLKLKLNEVFIKLFKYKSSLVNHGIDKLIEYCMDMRSDVQLEIEKRVEMTRVAGDILIKKIDDYEAECIANLKTSDISKNEFRSLELMKLFKEFDLTNRSYLQRSKIDEFIIKDAVVSLENFEKKINLEIENSEKIIFNGIKLTFVKNLEKLIDDDLGKIIFYKMDVGIEKDLKNMRNVMTLSGRTGHFGCVNTLTVLADGSLCSGSYDETIKVWDVKTGDLIQTVEGHTGDINSLIVLENGNICSGSSDKSIRVWDCKFKLLKILRGHRHCVNTLVAFGDILCSGSDDKSIRIWNVMNGECVKLLMGHEGAINDLIFIENGVLASCSDDMTIRIWNLEAGSSKKTMQGHTGSVQAIEKITNEIICSGGFDKIIIIWNAKTGVLLKSMSGHEHAVLTLCFGGGYLWSGSSDSTIRSWDWKSSEVVQVLKGHTGTVMKVILLKSGVLASGSYDKSVKIWDR